MTFNASFPNHQELSWWKLFVISFLYLSFTRFLGTSFYIVNTQLTFTYWKSTTETMLTIMSWTSFCCFYCKLWTYFILFCIVSAFDFEQVDVTWVYPVSCALLWEIWRRSCYHQYAPFEASIRLPASLFFLVVRLFYKKIKLLG